VRRLDDDAGGVVTKSMISPPRKLIVVSTSMTVVRRPRVGADVGHLARAVAERGAVVVELRGEDGVLHLLLEGRLNAPSLDSDALMSWPVMLNTP
jgi:hypothetical protein